MPWIPSSRAKRETKAGSFFGTQEKLTVSFLRLMIRRKLTPQTY